MYFDIHSHILPEVDDGAKSIEEAVHLLEASKKNGVKAIIATPHFYPNEVYFEDFLELTTTVFEALKSEIKGKELPDIYLGCEILYFRGLGLVEDLDKLTLADSKYLLIELTAFDIREYFFEDITALMERGYIPIIAHIERYQHFTGFKKIMKFVVEKNIAVQLNAQSVLELKYKRTVKGILKSGVFCVIASDTHSVEHRPPKILEALNRIGEVFGEEYRQRITENSHHLYKKITGDSIGKPQF
ncbi:MAG: hypothetical protein IJO62_02925 [Clostridia bacterium]|nr:hypothetical protein [Clostridia bacterium]